MKKLRYFVLLATLVFPFTVFATTGTGEHKDTEVDYTVNGTYEWTVPASVSFDSNLGQNLTIAFTNVQLPAGQKIVLKCTSENGWKLMNGQSAIPYKFGERTDNNFELFEYDPSDPNQSPTPGSTTHVYHISTDAESISQATSLGKHTDTLKFELGFRSN